MKCGVIMELQDGTAVLLDGSGELICTTARPGWRIGQTVAVPQRKNRMARWSAFAAALLLVITGGAFAAAYATPCSLLSLDVNPSVELTLNRFERVIAVRAMNDEGDALLQVSGIHNKTVDEALAALFGGDYLANYLSSESYVTMTVQSNSAQREQTLLGVMDAAVEQELCANFPNIQVDCLRVDDATVQEAHGCGVTAGKYLALMELIEVDPTARLEEYAHSGIGEIRDQIARCHQDSEEGTGDGLSESDYPDSDSASRHHHGQKHG